MYGQGGARNPSSMQGGGDRSQPGRYPSRTRSYPPAPTPQANPSGTRLNPAPAPMAEPKRQEKAPEAKQEQPTVGQNAQPSSSPSPQEAKSSEAKREESRVPQEPQSISSASQNESKGRKIVPLKDGFPDEEIQRQKSLQEEIKDDISNLTRRLAELHGQQKIVAQPGEESGVRVITLAGENRGANMDLVPAFRKQGNLDVGRGYKLNEENDSADGTKSVTSEGSPVNAYVNSNVQGANNSILYNSSCPQRNPGVHLAISNNPFSSLGPAHPDGKDVSRTTTSGALEMKKAMQMAPAPDQLTVKRRCLRALFLESGSDSEPETMSQKPIRHGCRYQCQRSMANRN